MCPYVRAEYVLSAMGGFLRTLPRYEMLERETSQTPRGF
jgi:hypothetical protein